MMPTTDQLTAPVPAAAMVAPIIPPMMAWVVETGAPTKVEAVKRKLEKEKAEKAKALGKTHAQLAAEEEARIKAEEARIKAQEEAEAEEHEPEEAPRA